MKSKKAKNDVREVTREYDLGALSEPAVADVRATVDEVGAQCRRLAGAFRIGNSGVNLDNVRELVVVLKGRVADLETKLFDLPTA